MRDLDCLSKLSDAELCTWLSQVNMSDLARCISRISPDSQKEYSNISRSGLEHF